MIEIMNRFVAAEGEPRSWMHKPFVIGNYLYATDGSICARTRNEGTGESDDVFPFAAKIEALFSGTMPSDVACIDELPTPSVCVQCGGSGFEYKCPCCNGEGTFEYEQHEYDCKECGGSGYVRHGQPEDKEKCFSCGGTGEEANQYVYVAGKPFSRRYIAKISILPGLKFMPDANNKEGFGYFTFDGGEGVIMPLRER